MLDPLSLWYDILVLDYTSRIGTNDFDQPSAIAGIAKVNQKRDNYIGTSQMGLWMKDLPWASPEPPAASREFHFPNVRWKRHGEITTSGISCSVLCGQKLIAAHHPGLGHR